MTFWYGEILGLASVPAREPMFLDGPAGVDLSGVIGPTANVMSKAGPGRASVKKRTMRRAGPDRQLTL